MRVGPAATAVCAFGLPVEEFSQGSAQLVLAAAVGPEAAGLVFRSGAEVRRRDGLLAVASTSSKRSSPAPVWLERGLRGGQR